MRIEPTNISRIGPSYVQPRTSAPRVAQASYRRDGVQVSDEGARARRAQAAAASVPEVRAERVAVLKSQVQAGTYQVDTARLAEKLAGAV